VRLRDSGGGVNLQFDRDNEMTVKGRKGWTSSKVHSLRK